MNLTPADVASVLAPTGTLRVSINVGNAILAKLNAQTGLPEGLSVDLARHLAAMLGVDVVFSVTARAEEAVAIVSNEDVDMGFFAVDPKRADRLCFSDPYLLIEGAYLVREASPIASNEEVDQEGHVVVVSKGSAYDNYLTRTLQHADIDRSAGPHDVVETFLRVDASVAAGIRPQLARIAAQNPALRLLEGRFMVISQALGIPKTRGSALADWLSRYLDVIKQDGTLADLVLRNEITGASIAPR